MIIFKQSFKRIFNNKLRLIILIVLPILFIAMFAMQSGTTMSVGIADKDGSFLSGRLIDSLRDLYGVRVEMMDEKHVYDKLVSYQANYCLIIEPGFGEKLQRGDKPDIKESYIFEKEDLFFTRLQVESFIAGVRMIAAGSGGDRDKFAKAFDAYEKGGLEVQNESKISGKQKQTRTSMGFLIQFLLYMSAVTAGIILEDKSTGAFFRVFYAPVTLKRYIAENLAAFVIVGLIQVITVLSVLKWGMGFYFGPSPASLYLLMAVFSLVCISLGVWLISLFSKPIYAYIAILLIATPLLMLGGCYWSKDYMSDTMNRIGSFLPTSWVIRGVDKLLYDGRSIFGLGLEVSVLLIFAGIFLAAGLLKKVDISK